MAVDSETGAAPGGRPKIPRFELSWLEIALGLSALTWFALHFFADFLPGELLAILVTFGLLIAEAVKVGRIWSRAVLWRLRNRMIIVYLLIAVIPSLMIFALIVYSSVQVTGQVAFYLVNTEFQRRMGVLTNAARTLARMTPERRPQYLDRISLFYEERFPDFKIIIQKPGDEPSPDAPPAGWGSIDGIVVRDGFLYAWARVVDKGTAVTLLVPLTRSWLASLRPGIGDVSIVYFPDANSTGEPHLMRTHDSTDEATETAVPPPVNRFDFEVFWGNQTPVAVWESPRTMEMALLGVHSRLSSVWQLVFTVPTESPLVDALELGLVVLVGLQLLSLYAGISLTRTITGAADELYEGTERIMHGDFSHRIRVRGNEQVAELSRSFNRMTETIERLLVVSKEKERMQAELQIAREVQSQLFPRVVPAMRSLELRAHCNPARMVSGDYYDYQSLGDGKVALALGDVAGKGISAALLMASLQASLRTHLRHCIEIAAAANSGDGSIARPVSTSVLVSDINAQLYADTAPEKYATFFLALYDDRTGWLTYTNAGHLPPMLVRNGAVQSLDVNGMVVGAFPRVNYDESRIQLEPGDVLVAYTDGITEPENEYGEMFGEQRLSDVLVKSAHLPLDGILEAVIDAVRRFTGAPEELQDDMTLVVARRHS